MIINLIKNINYRKVPTVLVHLFLTILLLYTHTYHTFKYNIYSGGDGHIDTGTFLTTYFMDSQNTEIIIISLC